MLRERIKNWCFKTYCRLENFNNCQMKTNGEEYLLKSLRGELKVVYDVGAGVGAWADLVEKYNPDCKIHLFEPLKNNLNKTDITLNRVLNQVAVSNKSGEMIIYHGNNLGTASTYPRLDKYS